MAHSAESLMGTSKLPAGMELYSFMFVNSDPSVLAGHVEAGKLPAPATLLVGVGVGGVLTLVRVLLDFAVYKPLARMILGIPRRQKEQTRIAGLDAMCSRSKKPSAEEVAKEAAAAGVLEEEAMQYVSTKKEIFEETKKINKFKEAAWRLTIYLTLVAYALKLCYGVFGSRTLIASGMIGPQGQRAKALSSSTTARWACTGTLLSSSSGKPADRTSIRCSCITWRPCSC
ncbi:unnamed protein product [Ascophyllum nodosum]